LPDIAGHDEGLTPKQEQAITALLEQPTVVDAAAAVGVNERTLRRWLKEPAFQTAYRGARRALVEGAVARLQRGLDKAAETLTRNLTCGSPPAEIAAARQMFEQAYKGVEVFDLAEQVEQLQRQDSSGYDVNSASLAGSKQTEGNARQADGGSTPSTGPATGGPGEIRGGSPAHPHANTGPASDSPGPA
jgi:hypothetical protein